MALLGLATSLAGVLGCGDPCVEMIGPGPIVQQAAEYEVDVYGPGVDCVGAAAAVGAPAPDLIHTYVAGDALVFQVPSGEHTVVLTAFAAPNEPVGSACQRSTFGAAARVCLSLVLSPAPDLSICSTGACPCDVTGADDCPTGRYCAASGICEPGCRTNDDCLASTNSDAGETVALPLCDTMRHACAACRTAADCVRDPACQGNVGVAYPAGGSPCVNGACVYPPPTVTSCASGCHLGACTGPLAALENVAAQQSGTQTPVQIADVLGTASGGGSAPSTRDVDVTAEVRPRGAAKTVTLTYFLNGNFGAGASSPMSYDADVGNDSERWRGTIPKQPAGTRVYFFVHAVGWDGTSLFAPGSQRNYTYQSN